MNMNAHEAIERSSDTDTAELFPVGARVESVGGGEDDECGYVRANLPGGMVEVGWDQGAVSVQHGSALRLV